MTLLEALKQSDKKEARRPCMGRHVTARFFDGTNGKRIEIENVNIGMECDPTINEWFADDWYPVDCCKECGK